MSSQRLLSLFPLNTVLFPGQLLPLHIFEERYKMMIKRCMQDDGIFGVVLIREGSEVGETATPFEVGTIARIRKVDQTEEGKMNILCLGEARFRIASLNNDQPYLAAEAEIWPWHPLEPEEIEPRDSILTHLLARYLQTLAEVTSNKVDLEKLPREPLLLAVLAAISLQVPNREKQLLLSAPALVEFIDRCIALLKRENQALRSLSAIPISDKDGSSSYSPN